MFLLLERPLLGTSNCKMVMDRTSWWLFEIYGYMRAGGYLGRHIAVRRPACIWCDYVLTILMRITVLLITGLLIFAEDWLQEW